MSVAERCHKQWRVRYLMLTLQEKQNYADKNIYVARYSHMLS